MRKQIIIGSLALGVAVTAVSVSLMVNRPQADTVTDSAVARPATVRGTVTDVAGRVQAGMAVIIGGTQIKTNSQGQYAMLLPDTGRYTVIFRDGSGKMFQAANYTGTVLLVPNENVVNFKVEPLKK